MCAWAPHAGNAHRKATAILNRGPPTHWRECAPISYKMRVIKVCIVGCLWHVRIY